jgi:acyl-CoA thioesterase I
MPRSSLLPALAAMLAGLLAVSACGPKPAPAPSAGPKEAANMSETRPVVVMLGDSLTAGYQLAAGEALPAAVQRDLDMAGVKAKVVNAGVSGDTTADGLNRYAFSVTGSGAKLLVVALGANDFLDNLPPDTPRKNLAAILELAKGEHLKAALVGVALPRGMQPASDREAAYAQIYPDLAKQYGVPYYSNLLGPIAGKPQLLLADGIHPTAKGVEAMAASLTDFLGPLVPPS